MTRIETAAEHTSMMGGQRRRLRAHRAAGGVNRSVIAAVEAREPGFVWDEAAAEAALAASSEIRVGVARDPDDPEPDTVELQRADVVADRELLRAFVTQTRTAFSATLHAHIEGLLEEPDEDFELAPEVEPLGREDEELVCMWLLIRLREIKAAQAA